MAQCPPKYAFGQTLVSENGVNKHFENVSGQGRIQKFFQGRNTRLLHILRAFFGKISL